MNTFLLKELAGDIVTESELIRSTESEKGQQIQRAAGSKSIATAKRARD